jgi:hypothetical protein
MDIKPTISQGPIVRPDQADIDAAHDKKSEEQAANSTAENVSLLHLVIFLAKVQLPQVAFPASALMEHTTWQGTSENGAGTKLRKAE